jgi:LysM repeat protein
LRYIFAEDNSDCVAGEIVMIRNDEFDTNEIDIKVDFSEEVEYSSRDDNENSEPTPDSYQKFKTSSVWIGVGLIGLVIFIIFLLPRSGNNELETRIKSLETRLKQVEGDLTRLNWIEAKVDQIEEKNKEFTIFMNTLNRLSTPSTHTTTKPSEAVVGVRYHKVRADETLYGISRRYGLTVGELRQLNGLAPDAVIHPGQKLIVGRANN